MIRKWLKKVPTILTKSGWMLVLMTFLTGTAAYQSSNNVLLLALSFFMSAVIINGLVSWQNFIKLAWKPFDHSKFRAKEEGSLRATIINNKKMVQALGLQVVFSVKHKGHTEPDHLPSDIFGVPRLGEKLITVEWTPARRGLYEIQLERIDSLYPFGFIGKSYFIREKKKVVVWPELLNQSQLPEASRSLGDQLHQTQDRRFISSFDQHDLREYRPGDSIRHIHWKKTAQQRNPVVRQPIPGQQPGMKIVFDFQSAHFSNLTELDRFCSEIATWVNHHFTRDRGFMIALHNGEPIQLLTESDFETVMDQLAVIETQFDALAANWIDHGFRVVKPDWNLSTATLLNPTT